MNFLWIIAAFLISQTMAGPMPQPEFSMNDAQTLETSEENQAMWNEEVKNWTEDDIKKGYREYLAEDSDAADDGQLFEYSEENEWAGGHEFLAPSNSEDIDPVTEFDGLIEASTEHDLEPVTEFDGLIEASTEHDMGPVTEFDGLIEASTEHDMGPVTEFDGLVEASTE